MEWNGLLDSMNVMIADYASQDYDEDLGKFRAFGFIDDAY